MRELLTDDYDNELIVDDKYCEDDEVRLFLGTAREIYLNPVTARFLIGFLRDRFGEELEGA